MERRKAEGRKGEMSEKKRESRSVKNTKFGRYGRNKTHLPYHLFRSVAKVTWASFRICFNAPQPSLICGALNIVQRKCRNSHLYLCCSAHMDLLFFTDLHPLHHPLKGAEVFSWPTQPMVPPGISSSPQSPYAAILLLSPPAPALEMRNCDSQQLSPWSRWGGCGKRRNSETSWVTAPASGSALQPCVIFSCFTCSPERIWLS